METPQPLPKLPAGWRRAANRTQGFAFGVPPGWQRHRTRSGTTLLRTPDRRIAVSISADRTSGALDQPLGGYAAGAAKSVGGLRRIRILRTKPIHHRYAAVEVRAAGLGSGGVRERIALVALRRDHLAGLVVLAVRRASVPQRLYGAEVARIVGSLRTRPVG